MPVPGWQTVLMSVLLAASCLGGSGQDFDVKTNLSHLLFLKSSAAGEPFNLELVVRWAGLGLGLPNTLSIAACRGLRMHINDGL